MKPAPEKPAFSWGCMLSIIFVVCSFFTLLAAIAVPPRVAAIRQAKDYRPADFIVTVVDWHQGTRGTQGSRGTRGSPGSSSSCTASGTIDGKPEKLNLLFLLGVAPDASMKALANRFPPGARIKVLVNPKLDSYIDSQRIILDRPDWLSRAIRSLLGGCSLLLLGWTVFGLACAYRYQLLKTPSTLASGLLLSGGLGLWLVGVRLTGWIDDARSSLSLGFYGLCSVVAVGVGFNAARLVQTKPHMVKLTICLSFLSSSLFMGGSAWVIMAGLHGYLLFQLSRLARDADLPLEPQVLE
jgi:hypothetical protein